MKIAKTDKRTNLQSDTLSDLLEIQIEGPPPSTYSPDNAVHLWWDEWKTTRRPNQAPRKDYRPRVSSSSDGACSSSTASGETVSSATDILGLEEWD